MTILSSASCGSPVLFYFPVQCNSLAQLHKKCFGCGLYKPGQAANSQAGPVRSTVEPSGHARASAGHMPTKNPLGEGTPVSTAVTRRPFKASRVCGPKAP